MTAKQRNRKWQIPDGVQDTLVTECFHKRRVEALMRSAFFRSGYDELETPGFEYYDVFSSGIGSVRQEKLIKFFDEKGRILALRPEFTMPIARVVASKYASAEENADRALPHPAPLRFFYVGDAYGSEDAYYGSQKEFTQAGIELIGETAPEADAEVIAVALSALRSTGLQNIQIDVGQVEFFKGLMEEAGLTRDESEVLRAIVDRKDDLAVELFIKERVEEGRPIGSAIADTIRQLPTLYGGPEVFDRAEAMSSSPRCRAAIDNLRRIYGLLIDYGFRDDISIDLGMLQSIDYYSGLVFKGYADSIGFPILSGGRYDDLLREFGADLPATGFAIGLKRILIALEHENTLCPPPSIDVVLSSTPEKRSDGFLRAQELRAEGMRVIAAFHCNRDELEAYAATRNALALYLE